MNKQNLLIVIIMLLSGTVKLYGAGKKKIMQGVIQFPHVLNTLPSVRVYFSGNRLSCETDEVARRIIFSLPIEPYQDSFFLLVTESIEFELEENTVKFLKVPFSNPYKLYKLEYVSGDNNAWWKIEQVNILAKTGKIPDGAIIICFNPDYVDRLDEGNSVSLPSIIIRNDLISLIGSEDRLRDLSSEILLNCLNCDTLHRSMHVAIEHSNPRKTLVLLDS